VQQGIGENTRWILVEQNASLVLDRNGALPWQPVTKTLTKTTLEIESLQDKKATAFPCRAWDSDGGIMIQQPTRQAYWRTTATSYTLPSPSPLLRTPIVPQSTNFTLCPRYDIVYHPRCTLFRMHVLIPCIRPQGSLERYQGSYLRLRKASQKR
jgi:hypothetical protein